MLLRLATARRVLLVGGKGGVGKTSIASAVALDRARSGARVLLVSSDPAHNLAHLWDRAVGAEPTTVVDRTGSSGGGRLDAVEIDPEETVERHLAAVEATMLAMLPERMHGPARDHLRHARTAPGTHESAVLERLAQLVELGLEEYDLVVVDTAPTGHTLRLLALPDQLTSWADGLLANRDRADRFGAAVRGLGGSDADVDRDAELRRVLHRRRRRFALLRDVVVDADRTAFVAVTVAERLPVAETLELVDALDRLSIPLGAVVVNRRSPADAGEVLARRRAREQDQVAVLTGGLPGRDVQEVPLVGHDVVGVDGLSLLVEALTVPAVD